MEKDIETKAKEHLRSRMEDLKFIYNYSTPKDWDEETWETANNFGILKDMNNDEIQDCLLEAASNYGLSFDYVPAETFKDQKRGYFRYQISWGGPSEEIRFYIGYDCEPYKIEFWFLDWFTGHRIELAGEYFEIAENIFQNFADMGMVEYAYNEAMEK